MRLYKRLLNYSKDTDNRLGKVDALEAIALTYKKQNQYKLAANYCKKSIATGAPTHRAYYYLSQIAFEFEKDIAEAQRYCREGLKVYPNNSDLLFYNNLLNRRMNETPTTAQRSYHTATPKPQANKGKFDFLAEMEIEIVKEMNFARTQPKRYARHLEGLAKYYEGELLRLPAKFRCEPMKESKRCVKPYVFCKRPPRYRLCKSPAVCRAQPATMFGIKPKAGKPATSAVISANRTSVWSAMAIGKDSPVRISPMVMTVPECS